MANPSEVSALLLADQNIDLNQVKKIVQGDKWSCFDQMTVETSVAVVKDFLALIGKPITYSQISDANPHLLGLLCWLGKLNRSC